jgi:hypothetical protein
MLQCSRDGVRQTRPSEVAVARPLSQDGARGFSCAAGVKNVRRYACTVIAAVIAVAAVSMNITTS